MTAQANEYWACRPVDGAVEVWSENGRLVARVALAEEAAAIVEAHNFDVDMERPEPPAVIKSRAEAQAERIAAYRREEPDGARLLQMIEMGAARALRLLSLKAPEIVVAHQAESLEGHIATFRALHPGSLKDG